MAFSPRLAKRGKGLTVLMDNQQGIDGGAGLSRRLPLDSLMATHRGALRQFRLAVWLLLAIGAAVVGLGLLAYVPLLPAVVVGVVTLAVAVFPYREAVERSERIEGLQVLQDEWRELERSSTTPEQDADRFIELLWKLYGRR